MKVIFDPRLRVTEESKAQLSQILPGIIDSKGVNVDTLLIAQGSKHISIRELGYDWYGKTIRQAVGWGDEYTPYVGTGERLLGRTHVLSMPGDRQFLKEMDVVTRITAESEGGSIVTGVQPMRGSGVTSGRMISACILTGLKSTTCQAFGGRVGGLSFKTTVRLDVGSETSSVASRRSTT